MTPALEAPLHLREQYFVLFRLYSVVGTVNVREQYSHDRFTIDFILGLGAA